MTHSDIPHGHHPRTRVGALLLLTDPQDRLVLVQPRYKEGMILVGGARHGDERPRAAALRECREEIGFEVAPGRLLLTYWSPPNPTSGAEAGVNFVYDGGTLSHEQLDSITLPENNELLAWDLVEETQLEHFCSRPNKVVIQTALDARRLGRCYDLEFASPALEGKVLPNPYNGQAAA